MAALCANVCEMRHGPWLIFWPWLAPPLACPGAVAIVASRNPGVVFFVLKGRNPEHDRGRSSDQILRAQSSDPGYQLHGAKRRNPRFPRSQRGREIHHHADYHWLPARDEWHRVRERL